MTYYFGYGSNMNQQRVMKREMPFTEILGGTLHGYELAFNKRSVKYPGAASANVIGRANSLVEGVLYKLDGLAAIEKMDPFEGYPIRYSRYELPVETATGQVTAWVYTANADYITEGLKPARWYLNHLLAGKEFLSPAYYESLSITPCLPDSDIEPD